MGCGTSRGSSSFLTLWPSPCWRGRGRGSGLASCTLEQGGRGSGLASCTLGCRVARPDPRGRCPFTRERRLLPPHLGSAGVASDEKRQPLRMGKQHFRFAARYCVVDVPGGANRRERRHLPKAQRAQSRVAQEWKADRQAFDASAGESIAATTFGFRDANGRKSAPRRIALPWLRGTQPSTLSRKPKW